MTRAEAPCAWFEIARAKSRPGAIRKAELGQRLCDVFVQVPAAAAEERNAEAARTQPLGLPSHEPRRVAPARACVIGSGPVRVEAERSALGGLGRTRDP